MGRSVLWIGDAGCHTGFAHVTHEIGERLVRDYNHDISVLAINHRGDYWPTNLKLFRPTMNIGDDIYGLSRTVELLNAVQPEVVVMFNDPQVIIHYLFENYRWDKERFLLQYRPILAYMPIDGYNQPLAWSILEKTTKRVAMSKFGQAYMPEAPVVYHGVDTHRFHKVSDEHPLQVSSGAVLRSKAECKQAFGYDPQSFLVLRVDKNNTRKDFAATWKALVPVMHKHEDIIVHFHCDGRPTGDGANIRAIWGRDQKTIGRFFLSDLTNTYQMWPDEDLVALYNAADLFVSTSHGEGFGLTLAEALACEVPVIAQNVSAIPEVVGPGGILLEPSYDLTVQSGEDQKLPDIAAFSEAIEELHRDAYKRKRLGRAGREHVAASFSWDTAAEKFDSIIEELAVGMEEKVAVREQRGTAAVRS